MLLKVLQVLSFIVINMFLAKGLVTVLANGVIKLNYTLLHREVPQITLLTIWSVTRLDTTHTVYSCQIVVM